MLSFSQREEKKPDAAEEAAAEARADEDAEAAKEEAKKRRKEKEHYLSNGEKLQEQRRAVPSAAELSARIWRASGHANSLLPTRAPGAGVCTRLRREVGVAANR